MILSLVLKVIRAFLLIIMNLKSLIFNITTNKIVKLYMICGNKSNCIQETTQRSMTEGGRFPHF